MTFSIAALEGIPEIRPGDRLADAIVAAQRTAPVSSDDVLVIAHKVISKSEGRIRDLQGVQPSRQATALAATHGKDPRHIQVVLDESQELLRAERGVLICVTRHGFVCANAGVDASNVDGDDRVVMLPEDPDRSARTLRDDLEQQLGVRPAVLITDSFGRAWRKAQCDVCIGCAGLAPVDDWRGRQDAHGRQLQATAVAVADELAAAADLARSKSGRQPVILIRGAGRYVTPEDGPGAAALIRPREQDLFR